MPRLAFPGAPPFVYHGGRSLLLSRPRMIRFAAALAAASLVLVAPRADACTFCGDNIRTKPTLRMQFAQAKAVLYGTLKNPRVDPKTDEGFTDLNITAALKDDPARGG